MFFGVKHTSLTSDRLDCLLGCLSLLARNNLSVLANRFDWHPATVFVCLQCPSLPSWAACMFVFGFVGDSLAATTTDLLLRWIQPLEMLTPGKQEERWRGNERVTGESAHYSQLLEISLVLQSPSDSSITVPSCYLWLAVSCDCQWKVLQPHGLETMKTSSFRLLCPWLTAACRATAGRR